MGKGSRHREVRRAERARIEARERAAAERASFFAAYDPEDSDRGPALPCPRCGRFGRRWVTGDVADAAVAAFDARWGLPAGDARRRVALCDCGEASVIPDDDQD